MISKVVQSGAWQKNKIPNVKSRISENWGGRSDCLRTISDRFNADSGLKIGFYLIDEAPFGLATGPNGQKRIFLPEEAQIARDSRRRAPHPPRIQLDLLEARQLKERLDKTLGLTKSSLARELGITRFEVIRRLNLLRLAPEIQERIMALPPTSHRCPISKRTLRHITVIADPGHQCREYNRLSEASYQGHCMMPCAQRQPPQAVGNLFPPQSSELSSLKPQPPQA